jgi:hypothetical protein
MAIKAAEKRLGKLREKAKARAAAGKPERKGLAKRIARKEKRVGKLKEKAKHRSYKKGERKYVRKKMKTKVTEMTVPFSERGKLSSRKTRKKAYQKEYAESKK